MYPLRCCGWNHTGARICVNDIPAYCRACGRPWSPEAVKEIVDRQIAEIVDRVKAEAGK
jgi:hypothetical protein